MCSHTVSPFLWWADTKSTLHSKSNKHANRPLTCCLILEVIDTWEGPLMAKFGAPFLINTPAPARREAACCAGSEWAELRGLTSLQIAVAVEEIILFPGLQSRGILSYSVRNFDSPQGKSHWVSRTPVQSDLQMGVLWSADFCSQRCQKPSCFIRWSIIKRLSSHLYFTPILACLKI